MQKTYTIDTYDEGTWSKIAPNLGSLTDYTETATFVATTRISDGVNSFFSFDLTDIHKPIESVTFRLQIAGEWADDTETLTFWDVSTDAETLNNTTFLPDFAIAQDLQSGKQYASATINPVAGEVYEITLNSDAIEDLNAALGGSFSIGTHLAYGGLLDKADLISFGLTKDAQISELVLTTVDDGIELVNVNDWYNPAWGGGFNATFTYTVQETDLEGGEVYAWNLLPNYSGEGHVTNAWMSGFNGTVAVGDDGDGFMLSTDGQAYQPKLEAGDVLTFSVQVDGAGFDIEDFCFDFQDVDMEPAAPTDSNVIIDAAPTNDWGSGLSQNVSVLNSGSDSVDDWTVILDVADGVDVDITNVWGATAVENGDGDIIFTALGWNSSIGAGGAANFGFNATYSGATSLSFADGDFAFV